MIVGDIAGKGTIYDDSGKAIVEPDEDLLDFFKGKTRSWVAEYQEKIKEVNLTGAQKLYFNGEFIITNKRILFLAEPKHFTEESISIGFLGGSTEDFQHVMDRSNITKEKNGRFYLQIGWQEIEKIRIGPVNSYVYLKLDGNKSFKFVFDKETGRRLKQIVGKILNLK